MHFLHIVKDINWKYLRENVLSSFMKVWNLTLIGFGNVKIKHCFFLIPVSMETIGDKIQDVALPKVLIKIQYLEPRRLFLNYLKKIKLLTV